MTFPDDVADIETVPVPQREPFVPVGAVISGVVTLTCCEELQVPADAVAI